MIASLPRAALIATVACLFASCGSPAQSDPGAQQISPANLPGRADTIGEFTNFLASVYFRLNGDWYYLALLGLNPLPIVGNPKGYSGPGVYSAAADFGGRRLETGHDRRREQFVPAETGAVEQPRPVA